jgi:hypothetical protein
MQSLTTEFTSTKLRYSIVQACQPGFYTRSIRIVFNPCSQSSKLDPRPTLLSRLQLIHELPLFAPSATHSPKAFLAPLGSQNPGLSSSCAYGFPGATPASTRTLASLLRSRLPAHALHWIGLRSGLESTTPTQRRRTEKRVSSAMSIGRLSLGSDSVGRRRVGEEEAEARRECS